MMRGLSGAYRRVLKGLPVLITITGLCGCLTLPVKGEYKEGGEKFLGSATGYLNGEGDLSIVSESGAKCEGSFRYINRAVNGDGGFKCSDGRTGDFFFSSNGNEGEGFGKDNEGKLFRFRFGGPEYAPTGWPALATSFDLMSRAYRPTTTYCAQYVLSFRCTHY